MKYILTLLVLLFTGCMTIETRTVKIQKVEAIGIFKTEMIKVTHDKGVVYLRKYGDNDFPLNSECKMITTTGLSGSSRIRFSGNVSK